MLGDVPYSIFGFQFSTDELIAWGTVVLVIVGVGTLIASWQSIVAARRSADAALAQVRTAYPAIDVSVDHVPPGSQAAVAHVRWLAGVLPARQVKITVRGPDYVHQIEIPSLGPTDGGRRVELPEAPGSARGADVGVPTGKGKVWRSISWVDPDDKSRKVSGEIATQ